MGVNYKILKNIEEEIGDLYSNIHTWMQAMQFSIENKVVCHSFIREYVFKNFDIAAFCKEFVKFLEKENGRIKLEPYTLYLDFLMQIQKIRKEQKEFLQGKPIEKVNLPKIACYYLRAYDFYTYIVKGDVVRGPRERLNLKTNFVFRRMIQDRLTPEEISEWNGYLTNANGFIWFTKQDAIPAKFRECSDNPEAAQHIQYLFGLGYFFDDGLIEVQIPGNVIENESRVPTIVDAGGYPYFIPRKRNDGFGRGLDLNKKKAGLPEAVHPRIKLEKTFKFRYVGDLPHEKKEFNDEDWQAVLNKLETELIDFLEGLKDEA